MVVLRAEEELLQEVNSSSTANKEESSDGEEGRVHDVDNQYTVASETIYLWHHPESFLQLRFTISVEI